MSTVMTAREFIEKLKFAQKQKTHYVMGCFGAPMNAANKKRYIREYSYNKRHEGEINLLPADCFGFDCVCFIKGILWGWNADTTKEYGGAKYKSNGVPDVSTEGMIAMCHDVSSDFSSITAGELVYMSGHVGVYVGDGKVIECTPKWTNNVQYSNLGNLGYKTGNYRNWLKHGKLPWIDYSGAQVTPGPQSTGVYHNVVKGDTLYGLGRKYEVDWRSIAKLNGIRAPWIIRVGQRLRIK